jgi:hypothetical protein
MLMANMNLNGLSNTETFTEIAQRAGVLRDAMADAQSAVNAYANDVFTMKAAGEVFTGIAAAGSIATGIVGMFGAENEKVKEILLKVQSAQAILNGVTTIANILNKDSALMLKIKQVWMKASTASTKADTVATVANNAVQATANVTVKKGTIVQTAWNTAKAIGKAMLGDFTGLLLLGIGAVTAYGIATADTTEKEKKQTDATNKLKEAQENYAKSVGQEFGRLMSAYMTLRTAWNELKTDGEKMQFLKEQKSSIDNLTDSVKDITSAERFFNQESDRVIESFKLRAKAAAAAALAVSKYQEAMESLQNAQGAGLRGAFVSLKNAGKLPQELKDKLKAEYEVRLVQKSWGPAQAATPGATSASYEEQKVLKGYTIPVDLDEKSLA